MSSANYSPRVRIRESIESLVEDTNQQCRFTLRHELFIWFSVTFYVADLCLDLWVCAAHFQGGMARSGWFIFFCFLVPNLYAGYKSLQWYLMAHEQTPIRRPAKWIIRVVFFPISPILRYIDAWVYGRRARIHWRNKNFALETRNFQKYMMEIAEVALLRLVIIFLEDAPIVVLNLAQLLQSPPPPYLRRYHHYTELNITTNITTTTTTLATVTTTPAGSVAGVETDPETVRLVRLGSVVAKLACTMTLGVVHYVSMNKLAWHLANTNYNTSSTSNNPRNINNTPSTSNNPRNINNTPSTTNNTLRPTDNNTSTTHNTPAHHSATARRRDGWESKGVLSLPAEFAIYCWQLLAIGSRVVAYAVLWVVYFNWLWLPITLRWLLHTLWIYFDVEEMSLVNSIAFGGVYLFSFVTTSPGRQILRIALYYLLTLGEHIIIALLWHFNDPQSPYRDLGLGVMFGGMFFGVVFLALYYLCCHPDRRNVWLRDWWTRRREAQRREAPLSLE